MAKADEILDLIEAMPESVTGLLLFGDHARSSVGVYVAGGAVCWAAATRDRRTLESYLRQHAGLELDPAEVSEVYRACSTSGRYVGEELERRGAIDRAGLRRALRAQAVDALRALDDEDATSPYFVAAHGRRPRDVLAPAELRPRMIVGATTTYRGDTAHSRVVSAT